MGGHSLRTEKIFVGKTSSGFSEDINREDEVTLTSVSSATTNISSRRCGEIVLPPEEQEVILMALEKAGVTQLMEFDEYITSINWIP